MKMLPDGITQLGMGMKIIEVKKCGHETVIISVWGSLGFFCI